MVLQKPSRELSVTEILRESVSLYLARFESFFIPFLLVNIANILLRQFIEYFMPAFNPPQDLTDKFFLWIINYLTVAIGVASVFIVAGWIIGTISTGIAVKYCSDLLEGRRANLKEGFTFALSRTSSLITGGFVTGVLMMLGFILFIVPGIIVAIMFSLVIQAIIIEHLGTFESLRRSRELVANRWGETFIVLLSVFLMIAVASLAGDTIGASFGSLKVVITMIIVSLAQPLHPIALTYLYYSLHAREKSIQRPMPLQPVVPAAQSLRQPPSPTSTSFQLRFCYRCGQKLPPDATFCPLCGKRVKP